MSTDPRSIPNPKIHPGKGVKPDGTPDDNDRVEIGPTDLAFAEWAELGLTAPNLDRMRQTRLDRLCAELQKREYAGALLFDPLNIRYATDSSNMQVWTAHNPARAAFVSADGYVVLWDFHGSDHLSKYLPLINEVRHGASFFYFTSGEAERQNAAEFAKQVDDLLNRHCGDNRRLAVDKIEVAGVHALERLGIKIGSGQAVCEHARSVKGIDEVNAMKCAVATCEIAMQAMEDALVPGISECELWAVLHAENIKRGGEWIETRILNSGPRSNPWMQECGPRKIRAGDILAYDTDLIGPYGMCADLSRTLLCGDGPATGEQRKLYQLAHEHIQINRELLKPGAHFDRLTFEGHKLPEMYVEQRYGVKFHGVGLCDEYPSIRYPIDFQSYGYDGELQPGQCLCVEAYFGEVGGPCGIKLEDQVVITENGFENLTKYPFEDNFLK